MTSTSSGPATHPGEGDALLAAPAARSGAATDLDELVAEDTDATAPTAGASANPAADEGDDPFAGIVDDDPFVGITNEGPANGAATRGELLGDALRNFVGIRKTFVQRVRGSDTRASVLADLVKARQHRELKLLMLYLALLPVLDNERPLGLAVWARMLHHSRTLPTTPEQASRAFTALASRRLLERSPRGHALRLTPLREDGTARPYLRPGSPEDDDIGPGYFTVPYRFWTDGLVDELTLPGTAMFLIILAETTKKTSFEMSVERAPEFYGISERTAERGYNELAAARVLLQHTQVKAHARSATGYRRITHRALASPYSLAARKDLQAATRRAVHARTTGTTG